MTDETFEYTLVDPFEVSYDLRRLARETVEFCIKDLGLTGEIELRWFRSRANHETPERLRAIREGRKLPWVYDTYPTPFSGMCRTQQGGYPPRILLDADARLDSIRRIVAHECVHVWQYQNNPFYGLYAGEAAKRLENDAEEYAKQVVEVFDQHEKANARR